MPHNAITFDSGRTMSLCGVPGRLTHRTIKPGRPAGLWFRQEWASEGRSIRGYGAGATITVRVEFDDEHGNGHNTFTIGGEVTTPASRRRGDIQAGGCIHDEIAKAFPELAHLIRWHLTSTDGPMHYASNTVYLAGDRDHYGKRAGEATASEVFIQFGGVPMLHKVPKRLRAFLLDIAENAPDAKAYLLTPVAVSHKDRPGESYRFAPKWQFAGMAGCAWHECPFDSEGEAERFAAAFLHHAPEWVTIATAWSEGKARDLDAARRSAVWPEATDAELMVEPDALCTVLTARLPALLAAFRADMEACGFLWSPADFREPAEA